MRRIAVALAGLVAVTAADANPRDSGFERRLASLDTEIKALEAEGESLPEELQTVERRLRARGRSYFKMVRAGLLPVGGGFDELVDHAASIEKLRASLHRDLAERRRLRERLQQVSRRLQRAKAERAPLTIQVQAMKNAQAALQQQEERRAAFLRAFGQSRDAYRGYRPRSAVYGATGSQLGPEEQFGLLRGRLPLPLSGRSELVAPTRSDQKDGVIVQAARDTAVRAVHPGRVTFSGDTVHGHTVVLDHGDHYFTVYGNLHHLEVEVGDDIAHRGRLGWVLRFGAQKPSLYFEVRRGERPVDAARWLGLGR
ncbi:MAG: M23 family metallopeptidase [Myxococcota bacterium]